MRFANFNKEREEDSVVAVEAGVLSMSESLKVRNLGLPNATAQIDRLW